MTKQEQHLGFWVNSIALLFIIVLMFALHLSNGSVTNLFIPPPPPIYPAGRLFTYGFQILCTIPPLICSFTGVILKKTKPQHPMMSWLWASAGVTGGFLINEIYRGHIVLLQWGIPKIVTIALYALVAIFYSTRWRYSFRQTPSVF